MHKESELTCWRTPLTDACIVAMTSLQHEGSLTLTFRADFGQAVSLVSFCFRLPSSYKLGSAHSYTEHIARKYTFKQYRRAEISTEGLLFNLKAYSRFADSSYKQLENECEFDRYVFVLEDQTIEVFSTERPDVHVIASQLKQAS